MRDGEGRRGQGLKKKAEEEVTTMGTIMPDDLHLMAIAVGGMSRDHLYRAGFEAAHFKAKSSQTASLRGLAPIRPFCADAEPRMMQRVEAVVLSVYIAFDEHMRWLFE
ncbi:hypothetical protein M9H77_07342 [Catharanthus roseus]|uniref:Uncharacterized protein n=1 Tax=Catharanthus roseus TaxID=4058 RepID=A0ACC0BUX9_CATRO|nr:hypothetical protein M9H77_07342 [Catharanthus roseus]